VPARRSVGQVAREFDLTETAVREWVKQVDLDTGRRSDGADQQLAAGGDALCVAVAVTRLSLLRSP